MGIPEKILVLDDETGITRITGSILKMNKYDVFSYNNPLDALKELNDQVIDVAIVDYMMPEMEGNHFIKKFIETHPDTRYIMLSAKKLDIEERKELFDLHVTFLTKPFKPRELLDAVATALASEL